MAGLRQSLPGVISWRRQYWVPWASCFPRHRRTPPARPPPAQRRSRRHQRRRRRLRPEFVGDSLVAGATAAEASGDTSIRPFKYHASDAELADLKRRIKATKWPDRETVNDDTQGVQLATMQKLADHWANHHDWRRAEAQIFSYPNFVTNIDGLDIHFIHVKSKHPNALPVIITHGWPGSIIEQLKVIGPLTDPTAHGGTAADAFDVVIPSLPGYGFSGKPTAPGWDVPHIARAWDVLMKRLGYTRYVAQGGDWGNAISEVMALQQPPGLLAIHTNMSATLARSDPQGASGRTAAAPAFRPTSSMPGTSSPTSTRTVWAMRSR